MSSENVEAGAVGDRRPSTALDADWVGSFGELYQRLGPETRDAVVGMLPDDWSFESKRVLDFGSGPGRTLRHFRSEAERGEFWGVDVDAASIAQLEAALCPPMHALRCESSPPLAMDSGSFDLAWAISVFTHLTGSSIPWLLELHRLLKPGGLLIATYMGRWHSELLAGEPWEEDRVGMNVLGHNHDFKPVGPMVLMSEWWVRAHWGRAFEILEIAPRIHNQSWALMRKRDLAPTVADLERPADDPREYLAARHNVRQASARSSSPTGTARRGSRPCEPSTRAR
ncbi:MAG: class I SAM-dependent methyltransferase [Solirubrobacterales bacterium]